MGMSVQRSQLTEYHVHTLGVVTGGVVSLRQVFPHPPVPKYLDKVRYQLHVIHFCVIYVSCLLYMFVYVFYVIRCVLKRRTVFWANRSPESATKAHLCCLLFLYYNQ